AARRASGPRTPACQKRRYESGRPLPFTGTGQLTDAPDDEITLDTAEAIDEQRAVQVIHLMLQRAREQAGTLALLRNTAPVETLDDHARRPHHRRIEAGNAQTAFFFELHAILLDEFRVNHDEQAGRVAADRDVHHENPQRHADLRGRESHSWRGVHRL